MTKANVSRSHIAGYDRKNGTITIIYQVVGKTTKQMNALNEGDSLHDFVGPLGVASHFDGLKKVAVVGGGLGTAIAFPQAKALHDLGVEVDLIVGFRNKDLIIIEDELRARLHEPHHHDRRRQQRPIRASSPPRSRSALWRARAMTWSSPSARSS